MLKLEEELAVRKARSDFWAFSTWMGDDNYDYGWHHRLIAAELSMVLAGQTELLCIEAPPGHGKSEPTSRLLPAFALGVEPDWKIIGVSHTADLAYEMLRDVKKIMFSDRYQRVFPGTKIGLGVGFNPGKTGRIRYRNRQDIFDVENRRGIYKASGLGGPIGGRRGNLLLLDDPFKNRKDANSRANREAAWRWYTGVFRNRRAKGAGQVIVSTRWHGQDIIGRIKARAEEDPKAPQPRIITLEALATDRKGEYDPREIGEPLWPWFADREDLAKTQATDPQEFAALFQQRPRAEGAVEWDESLFGPEVWFDDWPPLINLRVIALDPSKGLESKHGDYQAFVYLARTQDGTIWVEAELFKGMGITFMAQYALECAPRFERETGGELDAFGVETNQFQELIAVEIMRLSREAAGFTLPVVPMDNHQRKGIRILRLTPEFTTKNIRFRRTAGTRLLVEQLKEFPVGDHDDGPDALEMARRTGMKMWAAKVNG